MADPDTERRIEAFVAKYTPAIAAQLREARRRLRARFPRGVEMLFDNYNALVFGIGPTDRSRESFISIAGYPRWVTLFFLDGAGLHDPEGLLEATAGRCAASACARRPTSIRPRSPRWSRRRSRRTRTRSRPRGR